MEYITAGESHGPKLTAIVSGVPAGLEIDPQRIDADLARRQSGYGRGGRQMIEMDRAEFTSGVRFGRTTGAPIAIEVANRDWKNWTDRMAHFGDAPADLKREVQPRPGHADLVGVMRNDTDDCRNILERSSARETAARVAACGVAKELLRTLGVELLSYVVSIGDVSMDDDSGCYGRYEEDLFDGLMTAEEMRAVVEISETRCPDSVTTDRMKAAIDRAKRDGESLGGTFRVVATGAEPGLGSYASGPERLTSKLAAAVCSIPAIKGIEFGLGFEAAHRPGSQVHDPIVLNADARDGSCESRVVDNAKRSREDTSVCSTEDADRTAKTSSCIDNMGAFRRTSNNAGGLEGGMSTGAPIIVTAAMKPIPTLMTPLGTVNLDTLDVAEASRERSDVCAVPAAAVVAEGEVAMVLANAYLESFGCTNMADLKSSIAAYTERLAGYSKTGRSDLQ